MANPKNTHNDSDTVINLIQSKGGEEHSENENHDEVNHPPHYRQGTLEVIDAIEGLNLEYHLGNVLKYISRYKYKGGVTDLRKAAWYLARKIELIESKDG